MTSVTIGTRGSALAVAQAQEVKAAIEAARPGTTAELVVITTSGDDVTRGTAEQLPGDIKGLFVKELEEALLDGRVDLAVHSVKDLPTELPAGLILGAIVARHDPRDAIVTRDGTPLASLPAGARVGASSLRGRRRCAG